MSTTQPDTWPRLLADIGGTNARFALETSPGVLEAITVLPCVDFPSLEAAIRHYLALQAQPKVAYAAIGIANPVTGDWVQMTNHHWAFSITATQQALGWQQLLVMNDFTALALALPYLPRHELVQIGGGEPRADSPLGLLGPGTGLGVSALLPHTGGYLALDSEGGHVSLAPSDEREAFIWQYMQAQFSHVSAERLLSGPGLVYLYQALSQRAQETPLPYSPAEITQHALAGQCGRCVEALDTFCAMLGTVAANLVVTLGARGGLYIGGGIVPRLGDYFRQSPFRQRFDHKGRLSTYLQAVPVYVIHSAYPALNGVAAALAAQLKRSSALC